MGKQRVFTLKHGRNTPGAVAGSPYRLVYSLEFLRWGPPPYPHAQEGLKSLGIAHARVWAVVLGGAPAPPRPKPSGGIRGKSFREGRFEVAASSAEVGVF